VKLENGEQSKEAVESTHAPSVNGEEVHSGVHLPEVTEHGAPSSTTENHETNLEVKLENEEQSKAAVESTHAPSVNGEEVHVTASSSENQLDLHHQNGEVSTQETIKVEDNVEGEIQAKLSSAEEGNQAEDMIQENI